MTLNRAPEVIIALLHYDGSSTWNKRRSNSNFLVYKAHCNILYIIVQSIILTSNTYCRPVKSIMHFLFWKVIGSYVLDAAINVKLTWPFDPTRPNRPDSFEIVWNSEEIIWITPRTAGVIQARRRNVPWTTHICIEQFTAFTKLIVA